MNDNNLQNMDSKYRQKKGREGEGVKGQKKGKGRQRGEEGRPRSIQKFILQLILSSKSEVALILPQTASDYRFLEEIKNLQENTAREQY